MSCQPTSFSVCLSRTLETEELRRQYISPPVPAQGSPLVYPENGQPWIGRRIDYILFRESSISKHCRTVRVPFCFFIFSVWVVSLSLNLVSNVLPIIKTQILLVSNQEIEEVTFITQLAGLTDHIPVGLRLNVAMDLDQAEDWGLIQAMRAKCTMMGTALLYTDNVLVSYLNLSFW